MPRQHEQRGASAPLQHVHPPGGAARNPYRLAQSMAAAARPAAAAEAGTEAGDADAEAGDADAGAPDAAAGVPWRDVEIYAEVLWENLHTELVKSRDVEILGEPLGSGSFGKVYQGIWEGAQVRLWRCRSGA